MPAEIRSSARSSSYLRGSSLGRRHLLVILFVPHLRVNCWDRSCVPSQYSQYVVKKNFFLYCAHSRLQTECQKIFEEPIRVLSHRMSPFSCSLTNCCLEMMAFWMYYSLHQFASNPLCRRL